MRAFLLLSVGSVLFFVCTVEAEGILVEDLVHRFQQIIEADLGGYARLVLKRQELPGGLDG
jgi:hypothetical protein